MPLSDSTQKLHWLGVKWFGLNSVMSRGKEHLGAQCNCTTGIKLLWRRSHQDAQQCVWLKHTHRHKYTQPWDAGKYKCVWWKAKVNSCKDTATDNTIITTCNVISCSMEKGKNEYPKAGINQ